MKILFISHYFSPHLGGVEKPVYYLSKDFIVRGHQVSVLTEKYESFLKRKENVQSIRVTRFEYPKIKYLGLLFVWMALWKNRKMILKSDIVHIHDVFIWFLPFRLIFFWKRVYVTINGYEPSKPLYFFSIVQKWMAVLLSNGSMGMGMFLQKYFRVRFDFVIYGGTGRFKIKRKKKNK